MRGCRASSIALAVAVIAGSASADRVVVSAAADNTLIESASGSFSNGAGPSFFVGRTSQATGARRRGLLRFELDSALPPGAIVTEVELQLELMASNPAPIEIGMHRVLRAWGEGASSASGGSGAPSAPGDATWIHAFYDDVFWATAGGDFLAEPSALLPVGEPGAVAWSSTPELVADVQGWLDDPASNHGWLLLGGEDATTTSKRFASREAEPEEARPQLVVDYELPCVARALDGAAGALCDAYCETLACNALVPKGSPRACAELARQFARHSGGAALVCEPERTPLSLDGLLARHGVECPIRPQHERNPPCRAVPPLASCSSIFPSAS
jgi:hypothetical protein